MEISGRLQGGEVRNGTLKNEYDFPWKGERSAGNVTPGGAGRRHTRHVDAVHAHLGLGARGGWWGRGRLGWEERGRLLPQGC